MEKLNENATSIFCRLLKKLRDAKYLKLLSEGFMPLVIEKLEDNVVTPLGVGFTLSLCHYYVENGDLMRDPEMVFIIVDNRHQEERIQDVHIFPKLFQLDNIGLYEESIHIETGQIKLIQKKWQNEHCSFANFWLNNILQQGFFK